MERIIAIIGVGYVGIQSAIQFSKAGLSVLAYDKNKERIQELLQGIDRYAEVKDFDLPNLLFTDDIKKIKKANYFLIFVPTPINEHFVPNILPLKQAAQDVAGLLKPNDVVIVESTVYPGATRELMIPILEKDSGLKVGKDFYVGYSSERIDPGNKVNTIDTLYKVISGENKEALTRIRALYYLIFKDHLHEAPSLEVAESCKLLENIQRDVNIALLNEFAQIMGKMNISLSDVIDAAKTKWNFLPFRPGLAGGHCIPEDPYYLIYQANKYGALPNLVLCARQTNEQFIHYLEHSLTHLLTEQNKPLKTAKVAILGMSYKANVKDMRHSLSLTMYHNLKNIPLEIYACDPLIDQEHYPLDWIELENIKNFDALIITQAHQQFIDLGAEEWSNKLSEKGIIMDVVNACSTKAELRADILYWRL